MYEYSVRVGSRENRIEAVYPADMIFPGTKPFKHFESIDLFNTFHNDVND